MGGKVVQLVQGRDQALALDSVEDALDMFRNFPLLHVIDLDAAMSRGDNRELVGQLLARVRARVGGGVRSTAQARAVVDLGAEQVIVGTAAFSTPDLTVTDASGDRLNHRFLGELAELIGTERIVIAVDVKQNRVAIKGWQETVDVEPAEVVSLLEPYCAGILCTYVDREGMLEGTNVPFFQHLSRRTSRQVIAAGGISTMSEVQALLDAGIQVALGMAVYTGRLHLEDLAALNGAV